jgi:hypothetical protein
MNWEVENARKKNEESVLVVVLFVMPEAYLFEVEVRVFDTFVVFFLHELVHVEDDWKPWEVFVIEMS